MGVVDVGEVGFDTALNFALGLPKHDLGWPPQRPLFRDNMIHICLKMYITLEEKSTSHFFLVNISGERISIHFCALECVFGIYVSAILPLTN